jgi:thioester reductase-like protein
MKPSRLVFVTGETGYMGRRVIPALLARGHRVRALVREGSKEHAAEAVFRAFRSQRETRPAQ